MSKKVGYSIIIKMTILYLILGLLWIRFSDTIVYKLFADPYWVTQIQTYKGWLFIIVTSGALYIILKKVYIELSESREEYESLFSTIRDGLVFVSFDGTINHANDSFLKMFKVSHDDVLKLNYKDIMSVQWDEGEEDMLIEQILTRGYTDVYCKDAQLQDGTIVPFEVQSYKVHHDKEMMLCSVVRDISSTRKMMNELRLAKTSAEESDRLKTAFLQNMSHEIRTPMNGIVGFSEMLRNPRLDYQKRLSYIDTIVRSSNQLLNIVTDVLDISKIETGQIAVRESEFNINELIYSLHEEYQSITKEKAINLSISKSLMDNEAMIIADKLKVKQVFKNLLNNAIKFTEKGTIRFGYKIANNDILFFVTDTGCGIPPEVQKSIFERFRKGEVNLLKDFGGTGLGLAICKGNVDLLRGEIWVESEVGVGSQFYFSIPNKKLRPVSAIERDFTGMSVLVAEDEEVNFKYIREVFKNQKITVERALNGKEALEKVKEGKSYDIIFMDIRMPVMDGYNATREIRKVNQSVPIIAQTAFVMNENRFDAIQAGCNDYVGKPVRQSELLGMLSKYVPKS